MPAPTRAATSADGEAYGLRANLTLTPLFGSNTNAALGPVPVNIDASAPPDFDLDGSVASTSLPLAGLGTVVSSGLVEADTQSNLLGNQVQSSARVENLSIGLGTLLGIGAAEVTASAGPCSSSQRPAWPCLSVCASMCTTI
jgi:hypothetical protein